YGQRVAFSGKPRWYRDHWQMSSPRAQALDGAGPAGASAAPVLSIVPVYSLTEDLRIEQLRPLIRQAVHGGADLLTEALPAERRDRPNLPDVRQAMCDVHFPASLAAAEAARRRFIYEEFLLLQVALALRRRELRDRQRAPLLPVTPAIDARIRRLFPFRLTADQNQAVADICADLAGDRPLHRLLQACGRA